MARAPGMPVAQISALKPLGSLSLLIGISDAGVSVMRPASGASFESAIAGGLPCCQAGGGAGLSCACADANAASRNAAIAVFFMVGTSTEREADTNRFAVDLELQIRLYPCHHAALRRGLVVAAVGVVDHHRPDVGPVAGVVDAHELAQPPPRALLFQAENQVDDAVGTR